jgi:hypothetical protein
MMRPAFSFIIAAVLLQVPVSLATQLDKDSCTKLKNEQAQLEKDGVRGSLGRGPDWAKVNLGPEKMEQVRRLIEVDEQLLFRCGGRPLVVLPSDPDAAPGEGAVGKPERAPVTERPADADKRAVAPVPKATPQPVIAREARPAAPSPRAIAPAPSAGRIAPASAASAATPPPAPAAAASGEEEKKAPALKAAKAKAKKKSEDAYRPPASD